METPGGDTKPAVSSTESLSLGRKQHAQVTCVCGLGAEDGPCWILVQFGPSKPKPNNLYYHVWLKSQNILKRLGACFFCIKRKMFGFSQKKQQLVGFAYVPLNQQYPIVFFCFLSVFFSPVIAPSEAKRNQKHPKTLDLLTKSLANYHKSSLFRSSLQGQQC